MRAQLERVSQPNVMVLSCLQGGTLLTASTSSGDCVQFVSDGDGIGRLSIEKVGAEMFSGSPSPDDIIHLSVNDARWVAEVEVDASALNPVTDLSLRLRAATPVIAHEKPWLDSRVHRYAPLFTAASLLIPVIASYTDLWSDAIPARPAAHITVSSKHELDDGIRLAMVRCIYPSYNHPTRMVTRMCACCIVGLSNLAKLARQGPAYSVPSIRRND